MRQFNKFIPALLGWLGSSAGGAAVIGGGLGLAGSKLMADSQSEANKANVDLMREGWARDDQAIQRKVKDLVAAGLHPTLASGGGMSSNPVSIQPTIKDNPMEQMIQSAQRSSDIYMSKIQQKIAQEQLIQNQLTSEEKRLDLEVYKKTGIKPNQTAMGLPASILSSMYTKFGIPNIPERKVSILDNKKKIKTNIK